jgi:DNA (cytosine-5)-methyltransferase 1
VTLPAARVLSLFPGVDLLGRAFAAAGFCVVTGPDWLFGGDIADFHGLPGLCDGIIGGPPCQDFSCARMGREPTGEGVRLLREYLRVVAECRPTWWLLENVPRVPDVRIAGYQVQRLDLWDAECGGIQSRCRHIQFGHREGWILRPARQPLNGSGSVRYAIPGRTAALASQYKAESYADHCRRQGLPGPLRLPGMRPRAAWWAVGNGVPLGMGRVLAEAVLAASSVTAADCICGCGRRITRPGQRHGSVACRKRMERRRAGLRRCVVTWP